MIALLLTIQIILFMAGTHVQGVADFVAPTLSSGFQAVPGEEPVSSPNTHLILAGDDMSENILAITLQGNLNHVKPTLFLTLEQETAAGAAEVFSPSDVDTGFPEGFSSESRDVYQVLQGNQDEVKGVILYPSRILPKDAATGLENQGDQALLNLTFMMCSYYDAVAVTAAQYETLQIDYDLELPVLGDTTSFAANTMIPASDSAQGEAIPLELRLWEQVYNYALLHFEDLILKGGLAYHDGSHLLALDYLVAGDYFLFNPLSDTYKDNLNVETIEKKIIDLVKNQTFILDNRAKPVAFTANQPWLAEAQPIKIWIGNLSNLSWSSRFPPAQWERQESSISYQTEQKYITFIQGDSESANASKVLGAQRDAVLYPKGQTVDVAEVSLFPQVYRQWQQNTEISVPLLSAITRFPDNFLQRIVNSSGKSWPLVVSEKILTQKLDVISQIGPAAVFSYDPEQGLKDIDLARSHFLFKGIPFIRAYSSQELTDLMEETTGMPQFVAVYLEEGADWSEQAQKIAEIYQEVSPTQLADLFRQAHELDFNDITEAHFLAGQSPEEMGFLDSASTYSDVSMTAEQRRAGVGSQFTYRFDLDPLVTQVGFFLNVKGGYKIEFSQDGTTWQEMVSDYKDSYHGIEINAQVSGTEDNICYLRLSGQGDKSGVSLSSLDLLTDQRAATQIQVEAGRDKLYLQEEATGTLTSDGRQGEFIYRLHVSPGVSRANLAFLGSKDLGVEMTTDLHSNSYTPLEISWHGETAFSQIDLPASIIYLRIRTQGFLKKMVLSGLPSPQKELDISLADNRLAQQYLLSLDACRVFEDKAYSYREITEAQEQVFCVSLPQGKSQLFLAFSGPVLLTISKDNLAYQELFRLTSADLSEGGVNLEIPPEFSGQTIYIKISLSERIPDQALKLSRFHLLTS